MVSSRDRRFVSVEIVWLGLSPGRRRLRFSFQINDVKDPIGSGRPHCFAPVVGGGGYLVASVFRVNRPFPAFLPTRENPNFGEKNAPGRRGACPHTVLRDSIEGREDIHPRDENQGPFRPWPHLLGRPDRGGGYLCGPSDRVNGS
jgi:hypothetical protein